MRRPNFFIVGAPKCGTTALYEYLKTHPNIFLSTPKEPDFFCKDIPEHFENFPNTFEDYLSLFQSANDNHVAVGEATALYLYSRVAIKDIYQLYPDAKIIVLVRSPIDMAQSLHSQDVFNLIENEKNFEDAIQRYYYNP